jgi:hypothetical protein
MQELTSPNMRRSRTYPTTPATMDSEECRSNHNTEPQQLHPSSTATYSTQEDDISRITSLPPVIPISNSTVCHQHRPNPPTATETEVDREEMAVTTSTTATNNNTDHTNENSAEIVRNIASFLSFSDAISLSSFGINSNHTFSRSNSSRNIITATTNEREGSGGDGGIMGTENTSSWVIGDEFVIGTTGNLTVNNNIEYSSIESTDWSWFATYGQQTIETPLTPALVAISPGATPIEASSSQQYHHQSNNDLDNFIEDENDDEYVVMVNDSDDINVRLSRAICSFSDFHRMEELLQERRRRWAQEKITIAVFSHPKSLRSFCWDAYMAAKDIQIQKERNAKAVATTPSSGILMDETEETPETHIEPLGTLVHRKRKRTRKVMMDLRRMLVHEIIDWIFRSVPISVLLDVLDAAGVTLIDTIGATFTITITTIHHIVTALRNLICTVWDTITHCLTNPFQVLEAIISLQFNAMGKTSEVLASGIQSVATGVGSASNMALYRLSATANMSSSNSSITGHFNRKSTNHTTVPTDSKGGVFNKRLLQKLSAMNNAALVVNYQELEDDSCGLTRHAVSRTRRMMHYSVSLRPFVATVKIRNDSTRSDTDNDSSDGLISPNTSVNDLQRYDSFSGSSQDDGQHSPFMCTPQSFPPTPHSRQMVIAQRSQLSDDVVFLARDRLRVHDGLGSDNVRTRERSQALEDAKRLAIFAYDKDSGIELTCGKHIATKGGDMYYASARSMVAILRNCFVYFEFTVLPRLGSPALATLAIGLSTEEMPPNTLVGAWQFSVGLCTTGQILMAGQWCSPADPAKFSYGIGSTVGCLVCLDDDKAYETWDGVMVKAAIRLNVNGVMVSPPVSTLPMSGAPGSLPMSSSTLPVASSIGRTIQITGSSERVSSPPSMQSGRLELPMPTLTLLVPSAEDLYPTVTLQSPATSVVCRFSSEDVMATTREMIGAPPGIAVYAIDGSVILTEYEDFSS